MPVTVQTRAVAPHTAGWTGSVTLDQIDPASGILSVALSLTGTLASAVFIASQERAAGTFTSTDTATVALERPDGSTLLSAGPSTTVTAALPAASGSMLATVLTATSTQSDGVTYVPSATPSPDAALFVGTGTVTLPVMATARVTATAPGNFTALFDSQVSAVVTDTAVTTGTPPGGSNSSIGTTLTGINAPYDGPPVFYTGSITTPVQHVQIAPSTTGWTQALGIVGFDATLGRLESVNVTLAANAAASLKAENIEPVAGALNVTQTATITLGANGAVLDSQAAAVETDKTLAAFDGAIDDAGPSGETAAGQAASQAGRAFLTAPDALAAFTGTTTHITVAGVGQTTLDGPGALSISAALQAGATIDVSYTYLPTAGSLFDATYYLAHNPDVAAFGMDPYQHYMTYGWKEGRDPSAYFDTNDYLAANPDVAASGLNPLLHYAQHGQAEHRMAFFVPAATDALVDAALVYAQHPDVKAAGLDAATWFHAAGWKLGADPDALFDTAYYLSHNPDVAAAHMDPALHYDTYGWKEGRDPSAAFSTGKYLAANADVKAAGVDPLLHYLEYGQAEHRAAFAV